MTKILDLAAEIFGNARIVSEVSGLTTRRLEHRLEIRGRRDSRWRPLGRVFWPSTLTPIVSLDPRALNEDAKRATPIFP